MNLRIKEVCKAKGLTIVELAKRLNMSQSNMSNIANGKVMPSIEKLEQIANVIGVSVSELLGEPKQEADFFGFIYRKGRTFTILNRESLDIVVNTIRNLERVENGLLPEPEPGPKTRNYKDNFHNSEK